jgi:dTDP-4-amino-4,6-dideoxygalactose transaminase
MGAYGDGGIVVTSDEKIAAAIRSMRDYGQTKKYHHDSMGYNRRLDSLQAAVLRVKLRYIDSWNQLRREHAELYEELLTGSKYTVPYVPDYAEPVWHLYVIQADDRDTLQKQLGEKQISAGIHYPVPIHLQGAYQTLGLKQGDYPITERIDQRILSLPMYAELTDEMVRYVAETMKELA